MDDRKTFEKNAKFPGKNFLESPFSFLKNPLMKIINKKKEVLKKSEKFLEKNFFGKVLLKNFFRKMRIGLKKGDFGGKN